MENLNSLAANVVPAFKELQGLSMAVVAGTTADTAMALAAIRSEDKIVGVVEVVATTADLIDRTSATTVADLRATGTLTFASAVNGDAIEVNGKAYTLKTVPAAEAATYEVQLGADDTETAFNVAAALNVLDGNAVAAVPAAGVVTVTANVEGTAGNAYTLVGNAQVTASAATLTGGAAAGSILCTADTSGNKLVVLYFNKK